MERDSKLPFYAKATYLIVGLTTLFFVLYVARGIIVPIVFSIIIAILLSPLVNFFVKRRVNRLFSIIVTLVLTFVVIVSAGGFILSQAMQFAESWPVFIDKFYSTITRFIEWISLYFNIEQQFIYKWIAKTKGEITNIGTATIGQLIVSIGNGVVVLLLIPVYVFMILFYKSLLLEFVDRLFGKENQVEVRKIVIQIKVVIKRYLIGLVILRQFWWQPLILLVF